MPLSDIQYLTNQVAALGVIIPMLEAGFRKRLARKSGTQNIVLRYPLKWNRSNVTQRRNAEIAPVKVP